jgi:hypothetical protein
MSDPTIKPAPTSSFTPEQFERVSLWLKRNDEPWLKAARKALAGDLDDLRERVSLLAGLPHIAIEGGRWHVYASRGGEFDCYGTVAEIIDAWPVIVERIRSRERDGDGARSSP